MGLAAGDGPVCGVWLFIGMFIGIPLSILCAGDGEVCVAGDGEVAGICIPGILFMSIFCGDGAGAGVEVAAGICMPGIPSVPVCLGEGEGVAV